MQPYNITITIELPDDEMDRAETFLAVKPMLRTIAEALKDGGVEHTITKGYAMPIPAPKTRKPRAANTAVTAAAVEGAAAMPADAPLPPEAAIATAAALADVQTHGHRNKKAA